MKRTKMLCAVTSVLMAVLLMIMSVSVPVGALSQSATKDEVKIDAVLQDKIFTSSPDADYNGVITEDDATRVQLVIIGHNIY